MIDLIHTVNGHGGVVVFILVAMSVVAFAMLILKVLQFSWLAWVIPSQAEKALYHWHRGNITQSLTTLENQNHPVDKILAFTLYTALQTSVDRNLLREEINRLAVKEIDRLTSLLRPMELIASLSPLLGLLGTVLGMIEAFKQLESAGSQVDPALLSGGIWQALLTTAMGLAIAIPLVAAHEFMQRQVASIKTSMEDSITQVFTREVSAYRSDCETDQALEINTAHHAA